MNDDTDEFLELEQRITELGWTLQLEEVLSNGCRLHFQEGPYTSPVLGQQQRSSFGKNGVEAMKSFLDALGMNGQQDNSR